MRKSLALKTLLRSPLKAMLTFLLLAAASFALFSRITDYAVTMREAANAESYYNGVAALDNTVPDMRVIEYTETGGFAVTNEVEDKVWPTDEQLEEFISLPGITLVDSRHMTAGLVEDYERLIDKDDPDSMGRFILEGTYLGYEDISNSTMIMELTFDDVTLLAGEIELDPERTVKINAIAEEPDTLGGEENPYLRAFFDKLEKGSRCLVVGEYYAAAGRGLQMDHDNEAFRVLDGLGADYLETEDFTYYKRLVETINHDLYTYDIVYTSDMRSIPRLNERSMVIAEGRPLTAEDTDACVVNELFLETYGLSIGDRIHIELGDRLFPQNGVKGAQTGKTGDISNFIDDAELEIVGTYRFVDDAKTRVSEYRWSYTPSTIFVPDKYLPVKVPTDYKVSPGEFSVFIENAHHIEAFREAAEPLAAKMGVALRFSDSGWMSMKDSFETGSLMSLLTTVLYIAGAALALFLAVYLYIGRNRTTYAIMRTLGISGRKAGILIVIPLAALSSLAMPAGGIAGLFYTSKTALKAISHMAESAPDGYVPDTTLPIKVVILCLFFEVAFTASATLIFLWKMKKSPPLELLQDGMLRAGPGTKEAVNFVESESVSVKLDIARISAVDKMEVSQRKKYGIHGHVTAYILRHMRRGIGKTAVSLILAVMLASGIGMFVLARLSYQDAFYETHVKGRALDFSSSSIDRLAGSDLIDDFYCYGSFSVRIDGMEHVPMIFTNDIDRYLTGDYRISYAEGYALSDLDGAGLVCLLGQELAETLHIRPGDEITLLSDALYSALVEMHKNIQDNEALLAASIEQRNETYKVIGIIESDIAKVSSSIFAAADSAAESVYGQPFPFGYCEFVLADNERLDEVNSLLEGEKKSGGTYAPMASFYIDSARLKNMKRMCDLLESLFPIAMAAAVLIGLFGPGMVIIQSAREAAFLRILGVTKKRARCMLVLEQVVLCIAGIMLTAGGLALYNLEMSARGAAALAVCWLLYFLGCLCGASMAAIQVTRHKILELLQVKE